MYCLYLRYFIHIFDLIYFYNIYILYINITCIIYLTDCIKMYFKNPSLKMRSFNKFLKSSWLC